MRSLCAAQRNEELVVQRARGTRFSGSRESRMNKGFDRPIAYELSPRTAGPTRKCVEEIFLLFGLCASARDL